MIRRYQARIVWIGRRAIDDEIRSRIEQLAALGPRPVYLSCNAGDPVQLARAAARIRKLGALNGVIHSAIVLDDGALARLDETRFQHALESKVAISRSLARVFASDALDFVLFFSSLQSFTRAAGQSRHLEMVSGQMKTSFARCNAPFFKAMHMPDEPFSQLRRLINLP